ncbi:MAG: AraC family transcriptional regulator [Bacteroidales bacterium]|nr:AraC family transcriptional regulator [Bacteroidales bacterium]
MPIRYTFLRSSKLVRYSETAHLLGFGYTHHFNRIFKKETGLTPSEFLAK